MSTARCGYFTQTGCATLNFGKCDLWPIYARVAKLCRAISERTSMQVDGVICSRTWPHNEWQLVDLFDITRSIATVASLKKDAGGSCLCYSVQFSVIRVGQRLEISVSARLMV